MNIQTVSYRLFKQVHDNVPYLLYVIVVMAVFMVMLMYVYLLIKVNAPGTDHFPAQFLCNPLECRLSRGMVRTTDLVRIYPDRAVLQNRTGNVVQCGYLLVRVNFVQE
jgi:hypothetical protein